MSVAYHIVLEKPDPGFKTFVNGKAVAKASANVNRVARILKLKRIEDYVSQDLTEFFDEEEEDFHGTVAEPRMIWFDPAEGLHWATSIADYIREHHEDAHDAEHVLDDLSEYQELFKNAAEAGIRWHFEVDY